MKPILIIALFACVLCVSGNPNNILYIDPVTGAIKDKLGRELIFHGVNAVAKWAPYVPITEGFNAWTTLSDQDFANLQSWGQNIIRLGVMWAGLEPTQGEYNETYIQIIESIVNKASRYGIYTLLDMHQDLLSEKFCGDGLPLWMI
jgi:endoglycosylceramidase